MAIVKEIICILAVGLSCAVSQHLNQQLYYPYSRFLGQQLAEGPQWDAVPSQSDLAVEEQQLSETAVVNDPSKTEIIFPFSDSSKDSGEQGLVNLQRFQSSQLGGGSGLRGGDDIHKHVFAYVGKDEEAPEVIKVQGPAGREKHYKILFIKAPSPAAPQLSLPDVSAGPEVHTVVYVLQPSRKKIEVPKISRVSTPKPAPPKVFFIKYGQDGRSQTF